MTYMPDKELAGGCPRCEEALAAAHAEQNAHDRVSHAVCVHKRSPKAFLCTRPDDHPLPHVARGYHLDPAIEVWGCPDCQTNRYNP